VALHVVLTLRQGCGPMTKLPLPPR
jgi:hypothetical protein